MLSAGKISCLREFKLKIDLLLKNRNKNMRGGRGGLKIPHLNTGRVILSQYRIRIEEGVSQRVFFFLK